MAFAPWINQPNYLQAIEAGASLGARLRQQRAQEEENANRLRLSFAEQALRQQAQQERAVQHAAELALKQQQESESAALRQNEFVQRMALDKEKLALDTQLQKDELAQRGDVLKSTALDRATDNARQSARDAETNRHNLEGESHQKFLETQAGTQKPLTPTSEANIINRLSNQWTGATKNAVELDRSISLMDAGLNAARRGDMAAGSQAVLVTFQKALDAESVVRESEYARSAAGQALLKRIQGAVEKLTQGGAGVPLSELEKFGQLAKEAAAAQKTGLASVRKRIGLVADRYNIPHELVLDDRGSVAASPEGGATEKQFDDEASARAAGFKNGDIIKIYDPGTRSYRRAKLK